MRQVEYPATRLPIVLNQLLNESNQNIINAVVGALLVAQQSYLPSESVPAFLKETADFFVKKARTTSDEKMKLFCIEKAIQFLHSKDHLEMMS